MILPCCNENCQKKNVFQLPAIEISITEIRAKGHCSKKGIAIDKKILFSKETNKFVCPTASCFTLSKYKNSICQIQHCQIP